MLKGAAFKTRSLQSFYPSLLCPYSDVVGVGGGEERERERGREKRSYMSRRRAVNASDFRHDSSVVLSHSRSLEMASVRMLNRGPRLTALS